MSRYDAVYPRSIQDPEGFWAEAANDVHWFRRWDRVLDRSRAPFDRWFVGGKTNSCYNALDLHVERGRGEQLALIYDSPLAGVVRSFTYRELRDEVARVAGGLTSLGVGQGDRVIIYMPMIPEAVMAMLACARIGAIHSVVFGGFAAPELAKRIDDAKPKLVISASCGLDRAGKIDRLQAAARRGHRIVGGEAANVRVPSTAPDAGGAGTGPRSRLERCDERNQLA